MMNLKNVFLRVFSRMRKIRKKWWEYEKHIVTFINSAQQRNMGYVVSEDGKNKLEICFRSIRKEEKVVITQLGSYLQKSDEEEITERLVLVLWSRDWSVLFQEGASIYEPRRVINNQLKRWNQRFGCKLDIWKQVSRDCPQLLTIF